MSRKATFHPLAELELEEAARFYDTESPGLGVLFLDAVERTIVRVLDHPEAGHLVGGSVRRRLIPHFP